MGERVPEPILSRADGVDPEHESLQADSVGLALLVVLETLAPAERLAFVPGTAAGAGEPTVPDAYLSRCRRVVILDG